MKAVDYNILNGQKESLTTFYHIKDTYLTVLHHLSKKKVQ